VNPVARIGLVLAYAVLGLAATGRSSIQIATKFSDAPLPYLVSAVSALLYIVIAVALWRRWSGVALWGTVAELLGVLTVGTLGYAAADLWPDETVWTGFGSAYGWVPLLLPIVAITLLVRGRRSGQETQ
jgi:hypothetical protein